VSLDTLLILLLIAVSVVIFVGEPLIRRSIPSALAGTPDHTLEQLTLQKETLYTAIRDLDFDFHTGKVDQKDYTNLRQRLEDEALQVLHQLDDADPLVGLDSELERQILTFRQRTSSTLHSTSPITCPGCAATLEGRENFCPSCGQQLLSA
jgi:hypothetical protein